MQTKTIDELEQNYDLEISRVIKNIKKQRAKKVLLQFPEGLKSRSTDVCDEIEEGLGDKTKTQCFIWLGDCFGACDVPLEVSELGVDMIVQFGHSAWRSKKF